MVEYRGGRNECYPEILGLKLDVVIRYKFGMLPFEKGLDGNTVLGGDIFKKCV